MNTPALHIIRVMSSVAVLSMLTSACVTPDTYEAARIEAKRANVQLRNEQSNVRALEAQNRELSQRVDQWVDKLWHATERVEGLLKEWRNVQDEVIRLRIERELQRQRSQGSGGSVMRLQLEPDQPVMPPRKPAAPAEPSPPPEPAVPDQSKGSEPEALSKDRVENETRARLRSLMEELKDLLAQ